MRYAMSDNLYNYFLTPNYTAQKKYEALRAFFFEKQNAENVADRFGYKLNAFYSLTRDFREFMKGKDKEKDPFFTSVKPGRREKDSEGDITALIINLRKKYLSVPDIKAITDSKGYKISERYIHNMLRKEGFERLPRRAKQDKEIQNSNVTISAPGSIALSYKH